MRGGLQRCKGDIGCANKKRSPEIIVKKLNFINMAGITSIADWEYNEPINVMHQSIAPVPIPYGQPQGICSGSLSRG